MLTPPLVSIVIPVWNEELYIEECLESILKQSYSHWEVILVDDGSTDQTVSIVQKYCELDARITLFTKEHSGVIPSINLALHKAKGILITRMDGDDLMPSSRLSLQVEKLLVLGPKNLVTGKVKYFSEKPISEGYVKYENWLNSLHDPDDFRKYLMVECCVASPTWMMYKEDIQRIGFFEDGVYPEDYDFVCKASLAGIEFHSLDETILHWREYATRTSKVSEDYHLDRFWDVRLHHFPMLLKDIPLHQKISIWGCGPIGKRLYKELEGLGRSIESWVDIDKNKIGQKIHGHLVVDYQDTVLWEEHFIIVCVGAHAAKVKVEAYLSSLGRPWKGGNWLFFG